MKIFVKVKAGAKNEKVEKIEKGYFLVSVKARPEKGKANLAIERAIAAHFSVSPSRINIVSGSASKNKIIEIK